MSNPNPNRQAATVLLIIILAVCFALGLLTGALLWK